jgi:hypothetical protein
MAYYAFLDENSIVVEVIAGIDETDTSQNWEEWYGNYRGLVCKRTSYNTRGGVYYDPNTGLPSPDQSKAFRKNYAGIGYSYDSVLDGFIPPKPYPSWLLNTTSCLWEAPVPYPDDGKTYYWDEATQSWVLDDNQVGP